MDALNPSLRYYDVPYCPARRRPRVRARNSRWSLTREYLIYPKDYFREKQKKSRFQIRRAFPYPNHLVKNNEYTTETPAARVAHTHTHTFSDVKHTGFSRRRAAWSSCGGGGGSGVWSEFLKYLRDSDCGTHVGRHRGTGARKRSEGYPCSGIKQIRDPQCGPGIMCGVYTRAFLITPACTLHAPRPAAPPSHVTRPPWCRRTWVRVLCAAACSAGGRQKRDTLEHTIYPSNSAYTVHIIYRSR